MRSSTFATWRGFGCMAMPGTGASCHSPATPLSHLPHTRRAADARGRNDIGRGRRTRGSKGSADALTAGLRRRARAARSPSSPSFLSRLRARFLVPLALLSGLALAAPAPAAADTTAPTIASVTISSTPSIDADGDNTADTYVRGDRIVVDVRFSEAVTVSGGNNSVRLRLDLGADDTNLVNSRRVLKLKSLVGGDTLRFEHRVARRNSDPDGVWVQTDSATNARMVFTVGGATVTSTATGAAAVLTKSGLPTTGAANHKVDGSRTQAANAGNRAPTFPATVPASLEVAENNAAGAPVGRVSATDPDGDALTYALDSASDAVFDIDSSGTITVTAANALDYETKASYAVTVSVHDGKDAAGAADTTVDATHGLTITVTDVEEPTSDPPTIASVTLSSTPSFDADGDNRADTYVRGDRIVVDVRFSETVTVSGGNNNVRLRLDLGADDTNLANSRRVLKLKSLVGGDTLRFEHRVARRDSDPDGVWVQTISATNARTVFTVGGAAVTSTATGVAAVLTKSGLPTSGAANHKVDGSRTQAPAATNRAPTFPATAPTSLEVAENNAAGAPVGRVSATDPDGDALTYALDSASDAVFDIDASGAITVTAANALDHETKASYAVTVSVHDGKDAAGAAETTVDATHGLTITVTDVEESTVANRAPTFPANAPTTFEVAENNAAGAPVGTVSATDPDGDALTYTLDSVSDAVFDIDSTGAITVKWANALNHEVKASYAVTVSVHDGKDAFGQPDTAVDATHSLTVSVTDVLVEAVSYTYTILSSVTSTKLAWILPSQPAGVTVSAVEVQVLPRRNGWWRTVASLAPVADTDGPVHDLIRLPSGTKLMVHEVIGLTPGEIYSFRIRLVTNSGNADSKIIVVFKTGLPDPVADLSVSNVTRTTADLSWALPPVTPTSPIERELNGSARTGRDCGRGRAAQSAGLGRLVMARAPRLSAEGGGPAAQQVDGRNGESREPGKTASGRLRSLGAASTLCVVLRIVLRDGYRGGRYRRRLFPGQGRMPSSSGRSGSSSSTSRPSCTRGGTSSSSNQSSVSV